MGLSGPDVLLAGAGAPVTLVAHGLGATPGETRALVGGVPGLKVLPSARGHGATMLGDEPLDYGLLGRDLEAVADAHGATRAVGASMGAGALLSLLARRPDRFARVVLLLPAAVDRPRTDAAVARLQALARALEAQDADAVRAHVEAEVPADLHALPGVAQALAARVRFLLGSPGVAAAVRALPDAVPVPDRTALASVTAQVLLVAQEGDPLHPADAARTLAGVLPRARLVVLDGPGALLRERPRVRALVQEALAEGAG